MAKKEKKINLKELTAEELGRELEKKQEDLFKLKFRSSSAPIKNVMKIRNIRRDVARIHTYLNQKKEQKV